MTTVKDRLTQLGLPPTSAFLADMTAVKIANNIGGKTQLLQRILNTPDDRKGRNETAEIVLKEELRDNDILIQLFAYIIQRHITAMPPERLAGCFKAILYIEEDLPEPDPVAENAIREQLNYFLDELSFAAEEPIHD